MTIFTIFEGKQLECEKVWLEKKAIPDCIACMQCQKDGKCIYQDEVNVITEKIEEHQEIVVGSPVY